MIHSQTMLNCIKFMSLNNLMKNMWYKILLALPDETAVSFLMHYCNNVNLVPQLPLMFPFC